MLIRVEDNIAIEQLLTIGDYDAFTQRLSPIAPTPELMSGKIVMPAARPPLRHMRYVRDLLTDIGHYVKSQQLLGELLYSFEVAVDAHTILIPDLAYAVENSTIGRMTEQRMYGAPDFVCEIASPSTRIYDSQEKYLAFLRAGVREYWIVDPDSPAGQRFKLYERIEGQDDTELPIFREIAGNDPAQSRVFPDIQIEQVLL